jgi:hypothetical protein
VPFLFDAGYADSIAAPLPSRWPGCKILPKPLPAHELVNAVGVLLSPETARV